MIQTGWSAFEDFITTQALDTFFDFDSRSFQENLKDELELYNEDEDFSAWSFDKIFADSRWHKQNVALFQATRNFSPFHLEPMMDRMKMPIEYFCLYWPINVLDLKESNGCLLLPNLSIHGFFPPFKSIRVLVDPHVLGNVLILLWNSWVSNWLCYDRYNINSQCGFHTAQMVDKSGQHSQERIYFC